MVEKALWLGVIGVRDVIDKNGMRGEMPVRRQAIRVDMYA